MSSDPSLTSPVNREKEGYFEKNNRVAWLGLYNDSM
jgi:hypothetical protein